MIKWFKRIWNSYTSQEICDATVADGGVRLLDGLRCNPLARDVLIRSSIYEDGNNSQYSGMLNTLSNHCVGTVPLVVGMTESDELNDALEDRWLEWAMWNGIGAALREARRKAAQGGICILIPYKSKSEYDLKLAYRVVGAESLKSPYRGVRVDMHKNPITGEVVNGVEFHLNGEVKRVWIKEDYKLDPTPYDVGSDVIVWYKSTRPFKMWPECTPAFPIIPSMSRFLQNVVREAEFKSAIPMAVRLDPNIYRPPGTGNPAPPTGAFKYQPGMIPTLPPGTDLVGVAMQSMAEDRAKMSDKFCSVAARCIDMPKNLAISDSSDSNMATAHIDLQPWKYVVDIDRFDFEVVVRKVFAKWYSMASLTTLLPASTFESTLPLVDFNYTVLFNHPDPVKCATARATDLISGASTLSIIYSEQSRNARRALEKDAKILGVSKSKLYEIILASRSKQALEILHATQEDQSKDKGSTELTTTQ